ncbi:hypothetical protein GCM10020221_25580 [Streptomyces thioluteus]|uniref:Phosphomannomutase n=1 Tax=Streptomyces thioluteus TaxID=66431 RepID=A0ABN3WUZ5_STRTU
MVDAGNGMGGHTVPTVLEGLPIDLVALYFELDGTFPNHEANPLDPKNLSTSRPRSARPAPTSASPSTATRTAASSSTSAASRSPRPAITALVAARELAKHPGGTVIHNLITSHSVPEVVREHGGEPVRTPRGALLHQAEMARTGAIFGGEHSAHYYFRDFWNADTGMLAALHVLAALGEQAGPLSELVASYDRYAASGEINSTVADQPGRMAAVEAAMPAGKMSPSTGSTASPSPPPTGGSTSARPTPNPSCGSTSRPRRRDGRPRPRRGPGRRPGLTPVTPVGPRGAWPHGPAVP